MKDIYNDFKVVHLLDCKNIVDHTDIGTDYVDLQGFESAMVLVNYGAVATLGSADKVIAVLQECDSAPATNTSWTAVASTDYQGAFTVLDAATDDQCTQVVGYLGDKRYIRVLLDYTSAGTHPNGCYVSADAILGNARHGSAVDATPTSGTSTA